MSVKISVKMLIQIKPIETIKIEETRRLDFFVILTIANKPIKANIRSIKGLWPKPNGRIVKSGKIKQ